MQLKYFSFVLIFFGIFHFHHTTAKSTDSTTTMQSVTLTNLVPGETASIDAPIPFSAAVAEWQATDQPLRLEVRSRPQAGSWTDWQLLETSDDNTMPEEATSASEMWFVPAADRLHHQLQLRILSSPAPSQLNLIFINSTNGPDTAELMQQQQLLDAARGADIRAGYPKPFVISRASWCTEAECACYVGGCSNPCIDDDPLEYSPVTHLIIHHTATPNDVPNYADMVRAVWRYHSFGRCWGDIGYNYIIDPNGVIYEGHRGGDDVVGIHAGKANTGSLGVAMLGNYSAEGIEPSAALIESTIELLTWKADQKHIDVYDASPMPNIENGGRPHFMGHRDVLGDSSCPGDRAHQLIPLLRDAVAGRLGFVPPHTYIDELSSRFSHSNSPWAVGPAACGINGHAYYTDSTNVPSEASFWGEWQLDVAADGRYEVSVYAPYCNTGYGDTLGAIYAVYHAGGVTYVPINQGEILGLWQPLGEFDLKAGRGHKVRLTNLATDTGYGIWFDSIRLRPIATDVRAVTPEEGAWRNGRQVTLSWSMNSDGLVGSQTIEIAADPSFGDIVASTTLPPSARSYTHLFAQDYAVLYWRIRLNQTNGRALYSATSHFRLDATPPSSAVTIVGRLRDGRLVVSWSGADELAGVQSYTVEYRAEGESGWKVLAQGTASTAALFDPPTAHTVYAFRVRALDKAGNAEPPHAAADLTTAAAVVMHHTTLLPFIQP